MYGLVGRNGAGKSTTLSLLVGLLRPDSGWVRIMGRDVHKEGPQAREGVAFVSESAALYPWLTGEETAHYWGRLSGTWNGLAFRRFAAKFDLPLKREVAKLSKGMRTQLFLALAIGKEPHTYILDEPMSSLDPVVRRSVLQFFEDEVRQRGRTVVLSSHLLSDLEETCTDVAVIDKGRLKLTSPLEELKRRWRAYEFVVPHTVSPALLRDMGAFQRRGGDYLLVVGENHEAVSEHLKNIAAVDVRVSPAKLEDVFFRVIGVPAEQRSYSGDGIVPEG